MTLFNTILQGDVLVRLKELPDEFVDCIVTSPPYYALRDYGVKGQFGLEPTLKEYIDRMLSITVELKRVLKKTGTMFWNHGDSYGTGSGAGIRKGMQATNRGTQKFADWQENGKAKIPGCEKSLLLQAHRLIIRMIDEQGWILRNQIIWHKPNAMPSSVKDRFGVDFEPVFFFVKNKKYFFEQQFEASKNPMDDVRRMTKSQEYSKARQGGNSSFNSKKFDVEKITARMELGRNKRSVWKIPTKPFSEAHFATFPEALVEPMIQAGCPLGGICLDPFMGAGTTAVVAIKLGREFLGIELNKAYIKIANNRIATTTRPLF